MVAKSGYIQTDQLFLGLTRPAMIGGVSFSFFGINAMVSMIGFILTSDFRIFIFTIILHGFGVVLTKNDPRAVEVFLTKNQKCPATGGHYGGLSSYDMF